jgi:ankyrin repeat protein
LLRDPEVELKSEISMRTGPVLVILATILWFVLALAEAPGPAASNTAHQAVERALPLLQESAITWTRVAKCFSCHHQGLGLLTIAVARERGFRIDEEKFAAQVAVDRAQLASPEVSVSLGNNVNHLDSTLAMAALAAAGLQREAATDREIYRIVGSQHVSGHWTPFPLRLPLEGSFVSQTAWTIRALRLFKPPALQKETEARVARAMDWMGREKSFVETQDLSMLLLALGWTGASADRIQRTTNQLLALQRADGGWGQIAARPSDAYATGQALVALNQAGRVSTASLSFRRGIAFLTGTQYADGSWLVETRHTWKRGLPYLESGFPHGKNQFISYAGSAWATIALALSERNERSPVIMGDPRAVTRSQLLPAIVVSTQDTASNGGLTPLMQAALTGTEDEFRALLEEHPDVNAVATPLRLTALMCAAHDPAKVAMLIAAGANVRAATTAGHTALLVASDYDGAAQSVKLLLEHGADPNAPGGTGRTNSPLARAALRGDRTVAALLVAAGAKVNDDPDGSTALMAAVAQLDVDFTRFMLDHGANVESDLLAQPTANNGESRPTALMLAAEKSDVGLVKLLLDRRANVNARDRQGMTPLMYAASSLYRGPLTPAVVKALITAKADIGARTPGGETALVFALKYSKPDVIALLSNRGDR